MRGNETPGRIVTNFCTSVEVHDVITPANFYDCRLWGLSAVGDQILGFSIDSRRRPYNTVALPCECVIYLYLHCCSMYRRLAVWLTAPVLLADYVTTGDGLKNGVHCGL